MFQDGVGQGTLPPPDFFSQKGEVKVQHMPPRRRRTVLNREQESVKPDRYCIWKFQSNKIHVLPIWNNRQGKGRIQGDILGGSLRHPLHDSPIEQ